MKARIVTAVVAFALVHALSGHVAGRADSV
jgi:hypothetical protein